MQRRNDAGWLLSTFSFNSSSNEKNISAVLWTRQKSNSFFWCPFFGSSLLLCGIQFTFYLYCKEAACAWVASVNKVYWLVNWLSFVEHRNIIYADGKSSHKTEDGSFGDLCLLYWIIYTYRQLCPLRYTTPVTLIFALVHRIQFLSFPFIYSPMARIRELFFGKSAEMMHPKRDDTKNSSKLIA